MKNELADVLLEQIEIVKKSIEWCKQEIEEGRNREFESKLKYLQGQEIGLIRARNRVINHQPTYQQKKMYTKMLELKDLTYVPKKEAYVTKGVFRNIGIEKQFHFGCICLNLSIEAEGKEYSFFNSINLGDEYLSNILNLIFELFRNHMTSDWEMLNLEMLKDKIVFDVLFGKDNEIIAIGYRGKWINQKEVLNLLKEKRINE